MQIERIKISAYRSLWSVELQPSPFRVVVGANNSGKTNLLDAIHFLGEVHRHGIDIAVSRKGGFENIAHRQKRRTKRPMTFEVWACLGDAEYRAAQMRAIDPSRRRRRGVVDRLRKRSKERQVRLCHFFALKAASQAIDADFHVDEERIQLWEGPANGLRGVDDQLIVDIQRARGTLTFNILGHELADGDDADVDDDQESAPPDIATIARDDPYLEALIDPLYEPGFREFTRRHVTQTSLALKALNYNEILRTFGAQLSQTRLYQLAPIECRRPGVPIPSPELDLHGANLPAVVDYLQKSHPGAWHEVEQAMRTVVPRLTGIKTVYTTDRRLALQFAEAGFGRPWSSEDISDGTVQSLALFCVLFDPRSRMTLVEEPENSVHPWIIRHFVDACRRVTDKQVLVTTHSPVLVDHLKPNEVEIAWRSEGRTHVAPLVELDPDSVDLWSEGRNTVFEILDGGAVPQAIPGEDL
jgi:predicted ATPase